MFSNFSSFAIRWKDVFYMTAEHAYQSEKFMDPVMKEEIRNKPSAHEVLAYAREFKSLRRLDWGEVKVGIMKGIIRAKVDQHAYVRQVLLDSGRSELIEDSPTDSFWGRGPDHAGQNNLGKIWMEVREEIRKESAP